MTKAKRKTRVWTEPEKAAAMAVLAANGGNAKKTVRDFRAADGARINETTLRRWRDLPAEAPASELVDEATRALDAILDSTITKIAQGLDRPDAVNRILSKPVQAATVLGILIDKARVIRGESTDITETRVSYVEPGALRRLALRVIEGGKEQAS